MLFLYQKGTSKFSGPKQICIFITVLKKGQVEKKKRDVPSHTSAKGKTDLTKSLSAQPRTMLKAIPPAN